MRGANEDAQLKTRLIFAKQVPGFVGGANNNGTLSDQNNLEGNSQMTRIILLFMDLISINSKMNITSNLFQRIKEDSEKVLRVLSQIITYAFVDELKSAQKHFEFT